MKLHPTQPALALWRTAEHICSTSPFLSEKTSQRNFPYRLGVKRRFSKPAFAFQNYNLTDWA